MYWVDSGEAGQFLPVTDVPEKAILSSRRPSTDNGSDSGLPMIVGLTIDPLQICGVCYWRVPGS
jgi:hypothetical protein